MGRRHGTAENGATASREPGGGEPLSGDRRVLRVIVADGNRLIVEGISRALEVDDEMEVVGKAYTGPEVPPLVVHTDPDVVLLDLHMPKLDGLQCLALLRQRAPRAKVVILGAIADPEEVRAALARGASGYILKTINPRDVPSALRQAVEGSVYHAFELSKAARVSRGAAAGLTERERTILKAVARGLSNQAIARELWVTEQTVKFHLTNVYRKLRVSNRTEAARYAYAHGLARPENEADEPES